MLPSFQSYGNYDSKNYGVNALQFFYPGITLWYSYKTIVAFKTEKDGLIVRQNDWSTTTGKHLNAIDGGDSDAKKDRLPGEEFTARLQAAIARNRGETTETG
jgi:hypothetical protein